LHSRSALMRQGERVFVDSGAWIALALARDPLHPEAREQWERARIRVAYGFDHHFSVVGFRLVT
jgi:predicted nucleic acid-binding protein